MNSDTRDQNEQYVLQTGSTAVERLKIVMDSYGPGTERLLDSLNSIDGKSVADVGCGTGLVSASFAKRVGATGKVVGIDSAPDTLAIARKMNDATNIKGIEWHIGDAYATGLADNTYDVVYCRLLLLHLKEPARAVAEMSRIAKPGGLVICEDLATINTQTYPIDSPIKTIQERIKNMAAKQGTDWDIGLALPSLFKSLGLTDIKISTHQPGHLTGEGKRLAEYTFLEAVPKMIAAGVLTEDAARQTGQQMREFTDRDDTVVFLPTMIQVIGKKTMFA